MKALINLDHVQQWQKHTTSSFDTLRFYSFNWKDSGYDELEVPSSEEVQKTIKAYYQGKYLYTQLTALRQACLDILGGNMAQKRAEWKDALDDTPFDPFSQIEFLFKNEFQPEALPPAISQYAELFEFMQDYRESRFPELRKQILSALKHYDKFYARVHELIKIHRQTKNPTHGVKSCARKILLLFVAETQPV